MEGSNNNTTTSVVDPHGSLLLEDASRLRFALIPKQTSSPFFQVVGKGCEDRARVLGDGVNCTFVGPLYADAEEQAALIQSLVDENAVDGMAIAITKPNHAPTLQAIASARDKGIPVITFDSDDATSQRLTYVGTDNFAFGEALGKVLLQIDPTGGSYALISSNAPNVKEREDGVRFRLRKSGWKYAGTGNCNDNATLSIEQMRDFANNGIQAIIPVGGWPMFNQGAQWSIFADDHPQVLTVCADTLPHQMELLNRNKVGGLVGQIPFQMGVNALDLLLQYKRQEIPFNSTSGVIYGTELHEVITVPLNLPPPNIDHHYIGNLRYLGMVLWGLVTAAALACGAWTYLKKRHRVIRASQPFFLLMIVGGILITIATLMPLSFIQETSNQEDEREAFLQQQQTNNQTTGTNIILCTSPIWFLSIGFTTVFSALFAKTWRINKIFQNPGGFSRLSVQPKDVLWPFSLLTTANVLTLTLMTVLAPLEYVRKDHEGTDAWNRVISTYGTCQSTTTHWGGALPYLVVLGLINFGVLLVAILQAYQARSIQSEFSESHYIAVTMICILQTIVIAGPVLALVGDQPVALYVVMVCAVFIICAVTLGCIFGPKIVNANKFDSRRRSATSSHRGSSTKRVSLMGGVTHVFQQQPQHGSSHQQQQQQQEDVGDQTTGTASGGIDGTERTNTRSGSGGENLDDSHAGLRFWRSQVSEIEPTG